MKLRFSTWTCVMCHFWIY